MLTKTCTFTPNTVKSASSNRTAATNASSGGESVFDRLYRGGSVASSHQSPTVRGSTRHNVRSSLSRSPTPARSTMSRASTAISSRIDEIYEEGVHKARRRPVTDKHERELRDQRWEEREIQECTFRPKLYWGSNLKSEKDDVVPHKSPLATMTRNPKDTARHHGKAHPRLPKEIMVSPPPRASKHRRWQSPQRKDGNDREALFSMHFITVSPLRDPLFDINEYSSPLIAPRMIACSTVASESIAMTRGAETEYGSI